MENLNFHGTQILNNIRFGVWGPQQTQFAELNFVACSFDDNGQTLPVGQGGAIFLSSTDLNIFGGHLEGTRMPFINIVGTAGDTVNLVGVNFNNVDGTLADTFPSYISMAGANVFFSMSGLNTFASAGSTVTNTINWTPTGSDNHMFVSGYRNLFMGNLLTPIVTSAPANFFNIPTFNASGDVNGQAITTISPGNGITHTTTQPCTGTQVFTKGILTSTTGTC